MELGPVGRASARASRRARRPSARRPPASASTRSRSSPQVIVNASPLVRIATSLGALGGGDAKRLGDRRRRAAGPSLAPAARPRSHRSASLRSSRSYAPRLRRRQHTPSPPPPPRSRAGIIPRPGDPTTGGRPWQALETTRRCPQSRARTAREADARSRRADGRDRSRLPRRLRDRARDHDRRDRPSPRAEIELRSAPGSCRG